MRTYFSEFLGTLLLALVVVGSGIMAESLTSDNALQLLINAAATAATLWLLITMLGPVSGAHFNPVVTGISRYRGDINSVTTLGYISSQILGAILGGVTANILYSRAAFEISQKARDGGNLLLSELIATAGLIFVIFQLSSINSERLVPASVALWIFSAYFFTSSTAFANPAISVGRIFTNSFAGIAPHSALAFIPFQIIGGALGYLAYLFFANSASPKLRNHVRGDN